MIQKFEEFHSINESKIELDVNAKTLNDLKVDELNHVITTDEAKKLAKRFHDIDDEKYKTKDFEGLTIKDIAVKFGDKEYEVEWAIHAICCLFPSKYSGAWM